jgi:hypothetical protein
MGVEVTKPLVMWLTDPVEGPCPDEEIDKAIGALESWLVRRMLVGATTKAYNRVLLELLERLRTEPREKAGATVEEFLRDQTSFTSYWPGDEEVSQTLTTLPVYRKLPRARMRLLLEAIEDHLRGFNDPDAARAGEQQVAREVYTVEHVMPQEWIRNWPLQEGDETERSRLVQTLGNLTLLTQKFNSSISNAKWSGSKGKRAALEKHSVLLINRPLIGNLEWGEDLIRQRTDLLIGDILEIWPVPKGHKGAVVSPTATRGSDAHLVDLVNAGLLEVGQHLKGRSRRDAPEAIVLPDGQLEVAGTVYKSPSGAGRAVLGRSVNGWWWWRDPATELSLRDLWGEYAARLGAVELPDDDEPTDVEEGPTDD